MDNKFREEYEDLFVFLRNSDLVGTRLNLEADNIMNDYTLEGKTGTNKFIININDDATSLSFLKPEPNTEHRLVSLLSEFYDYDKDIDVSYTIKDINEPEKEINVYEWVLDKERIKKIQNSETISYPHYITNVEIRDNSIEEKPKNK